MPLSRLLAEQQTLRPVSAVDKFSDWHDNHDGQGAQTGGVCAVPYHAQARHYQELIPVGRPGAGEQFAFEVNLDTCTGCKGCVAACHSLNGLDDNESWRDIGQLVGEATSGAPWQQTVTTACHHCVEPGCLQGCPTKAYEKDPITGIVRHLDDQCIGCQYCSLKCPYDVPKYNAKLGIVRKCDMCHQRLAAGEAPACVQACPNGAIAIRIVKQESAMARSEPVITGAFRSDYTRPTTLYISAKPKPKIAAPPQADKPRVEHGHLPLVAMLVLTQAAAGACLAQTIAPSLALALTAAIVGLAGIHASILHLGQPLKAWKAWLGWRTSWLSREIIAFGGFAGALTALAAVAGLESFPRALEVVGQFVDPSRLGMPAAAGAACAGLGGVFASVMVYVDTKREGWSLRWTLLRFGGTVLVFGAVFLSAFAPCWEWPVLAAVVILLKLAAEWRMLSSFLRESAGSSNRLTALATHGPLKQVVGARFMLGVAGALAVLGNPWVALVMVAAGETCERVLFFKAQHAPRMPGVSHA